jgi:hypothetical protein
MIRDVHGSQIRTLIFLHIQDPGVKKAPGPRSRIRNIAGKDPDRGALNGAETGGKTAIRGLRRCDASIVPYAPTLLAASTRHTK